MTALARNLNEAVGVLAAAMRGDFCDRGHAVFRRDRKGTCIECRRDSVRRYRARGSKPLEQFLGESLVRLVRATDGSEPCYATANTEAWFSDDVEDRKLAAKACGFCHLMAACAEAARGMTARDRYGVWGGVDYGRPR